MPFYYFDSYYLLLVLPAIIFAFAAQQMVQSRFRKYSDIRTYRRMTGAKAAEEILRAHGVYDVKIEGVAGNLTDHYDPRTNVIRLSQNVHDSTSVAAVGIAAHEAGHAVQHAQGYGPIKVRQAIIPVTKIGSSLSMPLILIGMFFASELGQMLFLIGIILFGLAAVFQLITLPVEFNASARALETLGTTRILDEDELAKTKKVLSAAALTYVAALAVSLMQLFRLLIIYSGRRGRR
ncbi:MAG: zinc metallopeptidase [Oscillospiraceae bacterium]|nr:zinc metallopeptidase [Oscillospiraceae bacterium]